MLGDLIYSATRNPRILYMLFGIKYPKLLQNTVLVQNMDGRNVGYSQQISTATRAIGWCEWLENDKNIQ